MSDIHRVAIVTGAAQGIGRAIALRLADDGIDVAVNDLSSNVDALSSLVRELQAIGRRSVPIIADVSDEDSVKAMVLQTVRELGTLDIMIANAGIGLVTPLLNLEVEKWDRIVAVNLRGVMLCYKYAADQMIKQGRGGRIIGASSVLGKMGEASSEDTPEANVSILILETRRTSNVGLFRYEVPTVYPLSSSAEDIALALELAQHKITVNAYCPNVINTQMARDFLGSTQAESGEPGGVPGLRPLEGAAEPVVVASLVSYLVKPEAYFITGEDSSSGNIRYVTALFRAIN
ncbi:uncharacterized protein FIBRA_07312 [Fibroporia radiculosa]|uniref:3-oxoacyl-[acyl-carrier-protein] reductase n=1 Tax=Fibroporia radiculosa TaxID=599839 RepID=J4GUP5_9APHY|nr:uncharacterized protein FIBRA_07312 [Fibroporia radiculosa]CCM05105.1 predicted protein [Fibroporia radiculosa]